MSSKIKSDSKKTESPKGVRQLKQYDPTPPTFLRKIMGDDRSSDREVLKFMFDEKFKIFQTQLDDMEHDHQQVLAYRDETLSRFADENEQIKKMLFDMVNESDFEQKHQYIPVEIYLDTDDNNKIFGVYTAVNDFLDSIGFKKKLNLMPEKALGIKKCLPGLKKSCRKMK
jgi:hypothetical protein